MTGKAYIGVTTMASLDRYLSYQLRVSKLGYAAKPKLHNSMRIHPFSWVIEPFCRCQSQTEAYRIERLLIGLFDMQKRGYNIAAGGIGGKHGTKHSEETKKKMSAAMKGTKWSLERRAAFSAIRKGKPNPHPGHKHTEEAKAKISDFWRRKREANGV